MANRSPYFRFMPYGLLNGIPNVIVDGSATDGTVLTLSHWPKSAVPVGLEADLSAEMAMSFLSRADLHPRAEVVSNNHFDQDGLVSVFTLVSPDEALARRGFLVEVARAGDFATYRSRDAARVSMILAAFADPARSPLTRHSHDNDAEVIYDDLLGRLPELCDHPERYRDLWAEEDATLQASEDLLTSERVRIDEVPALDLSVVYLPEDAPTAGGHRFGGLWVDGLHPMALHNAIDGFVVLIIRGRSYEVWYRYESWVQYRTRRPRQRIDLSMLATELCIYEPLGAAWSFDGVRPIISRLHLTGADESALSPEEFRAKVEAELSSGTPGWDPYPRSEVVA